MTAGQLLRDNYFDNTAVQHFGTTLRYNTAVQHFGLLYRFAVPVCCTGLLYRCVVPVFLCGPNAKRAGMLKGIPALDRKSRFCETGSFRVVRLLRLFDRKRSTRRL